MRHEYRMGQKMPQIDKTIRPHRPWLPSGLRRPSPVLLAAWVLLGTVMRLGAQMAAQPSTMPATASAPAAAATQPAEAAGPDSATMPATASAPGAPATQPAEAATPGSATEPATRSAASGPTSVPAVLGQPMSLNFRDASLRSILEYLSEAAGLIIVDADSRVDGRVTLISRQPVNVEEAVALLDTVLREKGFAAIRNDRTLKIVTLEQAKKELIPVRQGNNPEIMPSGDRIITQIIPVRYVDAVRLKADLASLIPTGADVTSNAASNSLIVTGTEATVRKIAEIVRAIDVHMSEVSQVKVFQLNNANASSAARLITEIFREDQTAQAAAAPGQRRAFALPGGFVIGGGGGRGGGGGAQTEEAGLRSVKVMASADDRTNTLVVSASPDVLKVIEGVVKDLDADPAEQRAVFTYRLRNAKASNVEAVLNNLFGWTGSSGGTSALRQVSGGTSFGGSSRTGGTGAMGGAAAGRTTGATAGRTTGATAGRTGAAGGRGVSSGTAASASDLAGQVYVVADPDTNSLLITTATKNFERVKAILMDLDQAVPQVLIKVLLAEVTHDKSLDLGVEFSGMNLRASGRGSQAGTNFRIAAETTGFMFRLNEVNVTAAIRAIAGVGKLDVLSRPYILTGDNQQASIFVGDDVPIITNSRITDTGQTINTIDREELGITLQVTPHINPQGLVTLDAYAEISALSARTVPISETISAPVFARRYAQNRVAIKDGETIVIGGLMEDRSTKSVDKVPILGDIPVLGALFQRRIEKKTKTELLIFLTPHVAESPEMLKGMSESETAGTKAVQNAVEPGAFQEHLEGMQHGAATRPAAGAAEEPLQTERAWRRPRQPTSTTAPDSQSPAERGEGRAIDLPAVPPGEDEDE